MGARSPADALDAVAVRDFRGWRGLPAARYADFDARFPRLVDAEARGLLGSTNSTAYFRMHVAEGYPQHLTAWYRGPHLVLIETTLPSLAHPVGELATEMGEPAATLDYWWDVLKVSGGARAYPERGIVLFIGPESQLLRLSLFTPCDLGEYLRTLHSETQMVELPLWENEPGT